MKRNDHRIMISQPWENGSNHWTIITLQDKYDSRENTAANRIWGVDRTVRGIWRSTDDSYNGKPIHINSPGSWSDYEWHGNLRGGDLFLGKKGTSPTSQKASDGLFFDAYLQLFRVARDVSDKFQLRGALPNGAGTLRFPVKDSSGEHFRSGPILWEIVEYS
jgi:hypothetical protein